MNTARINRGTPLLLSGVTKRYGDNTILNALDLHIPAGQFVAVVAAAAAERVPCYGFWPGWRCQTAAIFWLVPRRWQIFRMIPA